MTISINQSITFMFAVNLFIHQILIINEISNLRKKYKSKTFFTSGVIVSYASFRSQILHYSILKNCWSPSDFHWNIFLVSECGPPLAPPSRFTSYWTCRLSHFYFAFVCLCQLIRPYVISQWFWNLTLSRISQCLCMNKDSWSFEIFIFVL